MSDAIDRPAILARRAALVASALASLGAGPDAPVCGAPSAEDQERAKQLFALAVSEGESGDHAAELELLRQVHRLMRSPKSALHLARVLWRDKSSETLVVIDEALACSGPDEPLSALRGDVVFATGEITWVAPRTFEVEVDGYIRQSARPTLPDGTRSDEEAVTLRVVPGTHDVRVRAAGATEQQLRVQVAVGETQRVALDIPVEPPPLPCLQPWPPPDFREHGRASPASRGTVELGLSAIAPIVALGTTAPVVSGGGGLDLAVAGEAAPDAWLGLRFFGALAGGDATWLAAGVLADARWQATPVFACGGGISAGLGATLSGATGIAPLWGPVAVPVAITADAFRLELRVPVWLDGHPERGHVVVAPQLAVGFALPVAGKPEAPSVATRTPR